MSIATLSPNTVNSISGGQSVTITGSGFLFGGGQTTISTGNSPQCVFGAVRVGASIISDTSAQYINFYLFIVLDV
jgi:hypothetical protein